MLDKLNEFGTLCQQYVFGGAKAVNGIQIEKGLQQRRSSLLPAFPLDKGLPSGPPTNPKAILVSASEGEESEIDCTDWELPGKIKPIFEGHRDLLNKAKNENKGFVRMRDIIDQFVDLEKIVCVVSSTLFF